MSIIAYPLEATEYNAEDVQSYLSTRTSGVYSKDIDFTPEGMTVTISPFLAWFNYAKFKGCSVAVTEPETLTFSPAHAVLDRIDRVVLRLDFTLNKAYFTVLEGEPSSSPIPKQITKTEVINDISPICVRIRAGATEITPSDITSTILDENVCGIMRDGVTGIPTSQLQKQAEELILKLHEAISEVQEGSAFMIGDVYDPEKKSKPVAFDDEVLKLSGGNMTGYPNNVNRSSFAAFAKEREGQDGSVYSVVFGAGAVENAVSAALEVADIDNGERNVVARLDVSKSKATYTNAKAKTSELFGEHNKPSGSYKGNGQLSREIEIGGIGNVICWYSKTKKAGGFVTNKGAFLIQESDVGFVDNMTYSNGILTIKDIGDEANAEGITYYYQVL